MGSFLSELGTRLADRWLAQLVLRGLMLVGLSVTAALLGQGNALDWRDLDAHATHALHTASQLTATGQVLLFARIVLWCAAIGGVVRAASEPARIVWSGEWPRWSGPLARRLTARRLRRWDALQAQLSARRAQVPPQERSAALLSELAELSRRRDRIALAAATRPTSTGDSLATIGAHVLNQYGVDLSACWPRMWVLLPVDVREELRAARARLDTAVVASAWAACYAVLACFWRPAALIAAGTGLVAWVRGRARDHLTIGTVRMRPFTSADDVLGEIRVAPSGSPGNTCRMENVRLYRWSYGSAPLNDDEWHVVEMEDDGSEQQALCGFPVNLEKQGARWGSPDTFPRHDECTDIYNAEHSGDPLATRLA